MIKLGEAVKQQGLEWLAERKKGLGSSDVSVLMFENPWKSIEELWLDKAMTPASLEESKPNYAMQRGIDLEPVARDIYEHQTGILMPAQNFTHHKHSFMKYSSDGFNKELNFGIEIKCPGKADIATAAQGQVPKKYYAQLQWGMMCSRSQFMDYVTFDGNGKIYITRVNEDYRYQRELYWRAIWFWRCHVETKRELKIRTVRCVQMPKV